MSENQNSSQNEVENEELNDIKISQAYQDEDNQGENHFTNRGGDGYQPDLEESREKVEDEIENQQPEDVQINLPVNNSDISDNEDENEKKDQDDLNSDKSRSLENSKDNQSSSSENEINTNIVKNNNKKDSNPLNDNKDEKYNQAEKIKDAIDNPKKYIVQFNPNDMSLLLFSKNSSQASKNYLPDSHEQIREYSKKIEIEKENRDKKPKLIHKPSLIGKEENRKEENKIEREEKKEEEEEEEEEEDEEKIITERKYIIDTLHDSKHNEYYGEVNNKKRDGWGIINWFDEKGKVKMFYQGRFVENKMQGFGIMYDENKNYYEGEWKNDKKHGFGILENNNIIYKGEFKNGKMDGFGVTIIKSENNGEDKIQYEGSFSNNKKNGYGTYFWDKNEYYQGKFLENSMSGYGKIISGKNITEGHFENGEKYGLCIVKKNEGDQKFKFIGNYAKGVKNGWGKYYYTSGNIFIAKWKDDVKEGLSKLIYNNGKNHKYYEFSKEGEQKEISDIEASHKYKDDLVNINNWEKNEKYDILVEDEK